MVTTSESIKENSVPKLHNGSARLGNLYVDF